MTFVHDHADFDALLQIVSQNNRLGVGLVEKDYWVTHTLWALHAQGFEVWFKGGTSLSKGFSLIEQCAYNAFRRDAIGPMFWGERTTLAACAEVRAWLAAEFG